MLWRISALKDLLSQGLFPRNSGEAIYALIIANKFIVNLIFACGIMFYRKAQQLQHEALLIKYTD